MSGNRRTQVLDVSDKSLQRIFSASSTDKKPDGQPGEQGRVSQTKTKQRGSTAQRHAPAAFTAFRRSFSFKSTARPYGGETLTSPSPPGGFDARLCGCCGAW